MYINQNIAYFIISMNILYQLFLRDIHEELFSLKDVDDYPSNFAAKIKTLDKVKKQLKNIFLKK